MGVGVFLWARYPCQANLERLARISVVDIRDFVNIGTRKSTCKAVYFFTSIDKSVRIPSRKIAMSRFPRMSVGAPVFVTREGTLSFSRVEMMGFARGVGKGGSHSADSRHRVNQAVLLARTCKVISQKVFIKSFCISQSPHKSVNLLFVHVTIKDKLTNFCGN